MTIPLLILGLVVVLIAVRQVGDVRLQIWQIMAVGAAAMLATGSIGPRDALKAIDLDVMLFLFGMFILGRALEESGALAALSFRLFSHARSVDGLVLLILLGGGLCSALLMNDTVAIVGVPVVFSLARAHRIAPRLPLLALAFAVTAGSALSPIGNPQNLLIALGGPPEAIGNAFVTFAAWLAIPTLGALALSYAALRITERGEFHGRTLAHERSVITDPVLGRISLVALGVLLILIAVRVVVVSAGIEFDIPLTVIALVPAGIVLIASPRRLPLARGIDWPTLAFFAALFVVVEAVDEAGVTARVVEDLGDRVASISWILGVSAAVSQVVSNVPLVALYLPAITHVGTEAATSARPLMALAAGSTLAGNLTLIGAASNVIIVDVAERRFGERVSFWEFTRVGAPLGIAQLLLTWGWLSLL